MILCILHIETRVGIKVISIILQDSFSNMKEELLESTSNINSEHRREEIYKSSINLLLNNHVLGNNINKYQYDLLLENNPSGIGRRIGIINFQTYKN